MTRATLRDVAAQAGVSHQTVSNVLNDHPSIRPATRVKVLTAIEALDYHPNVAAKALRESRVTTLCCAFYEHSADDITDPYRNLVQSAFIAEAMANGYSITTAFLHGAQPESFAALRRTFLGKQFGGVVIVGTTLKSEQLEEFTRWEMPTVLFDHTDPAGSMSSVSGQYESGMAQLVAHHVSRGRRRLTLILPPDDQGSTAVLRRRGFLEAAASHGVSAQMTDGDWSSESGEAAFYRLWQSAQRPDAVLCGNDRMAAGALLAARTLGLDVPGDVAISGFDDFEFARYTAPSLTTVHVPHGEMARRAVRLLLKNLDPASDADREGTGKTVPVSVQVPVRLIVRESA